MSDKAAELREQMYKDAANRLHHLSMRYSGALLELVTGKPVGMIPVDHPGLHDCRDFMDLILLTRAEINGLTRLLVEAKVIDNVRVIDVFREEYDWLANVKAKQFGCEVDDHGLVFKTGVDKS